MRAMLAVLTMLAHLGASRRAHHEREVMVLVEAIMVLLPFGGFVIVVI